MLSSQGCSSNGNMLRVPCSDPGMVYQIVEQSMFTKGIDDYDMESGSRDAKRKECGQCDVSIFSLLWECLGKPRQFHDCALPLLSLDDAASDCSALLRMRRVYSRP